MARTYAQKWRGNELNNFVVLQFMSWQLEDENVASKITIICIVFVNRHV